MSPSNEERDGSSAEQDSEVKQLRDFLQEDPEGLMKEKRIDKPPHPTFQDLAWAKYVEDKTWQEIARQTGLCVPTLSSFFQRTLRKLTPYFQKYLQS